MTTPAVILEFVVGLVATITVFLVALGVVCFLCLKHYYLARRKGYTPMAAGGWVFGAVIGALAIGFLFIALTDDSEWTNAKKNAVVFLSLAVAPPLAVAAVVRSLPRRTARHAGARSSLSWLSRNARGLERVIHWSGAAVVAIGISGLWWLPDANSAVRMISTGVALFGAPTTLAYFRQRAGAPTLEAAVAADHRPPVLYLRAFYQESDAFTWGPKEQMARYTAAPITAQTANTISVNFEQFLSAALSQQIGPFVALGNPEDFLPPEGAARLYAEDFDWQPQFLKLAERARAIVMEVSRSENLQWEINTIRSRNWQCKLFVIVPPVPRPNRLGYRWFFAALRAAKGVPPPRWDAFATELVNAGFHVGLRDPDPGSVVSFDRAGRAEVIGRGAADPEAFAAAISTRLGGLSLM